MREILRSKIHRCWITGANLGYVGSILIDRDLMEMSDIVPFEKVQVVNCNNGARFETYALPGERGSGVISVQARRPGSANSETARSSWPSRSPTRKLTSA